MKSILILTLVILISSACGNSTLEKVDETATSSAIQNPIESDRHHNHENEVIELNKGEKWKVNLEMMPFIQNGGKLVADFIQQKSSDYQTLAKKLKQENEQLISSCTMQGKSHDELHKWLHPHLELVESLSLASGNEAKTIVFKLDKSYQKFSEYFQ